MAYSRKTKNPRGNELKAPLSELVVTGGRLIAARTDGGRALARPYRDLNALFVWAEPGVLVDKSPETVTAV